MNRRFTFVVVIASLLFAERPCFCQFQILKDLFGGRAAKPRQPFGGHQLLNEAITAAESGDTAKSLKLASDAFQSGGLADSLEHPEAKTVAMNLVRLSQIWELNKADPAAVTAVLNEVVFPSKLPGEIKPYPVMWSLSYDMYLFSRSNSRIPTPDSVGAELVRWTVLAKQTDELQRRLQSIQVVAENRPADQDEKKGDKKANRLDPAAAKMNAIIARVVEVQLAVAENDNEKATAVLKRLSEDAVQTNGATTEYLCHAASSAFSNSKSLAAGLELLESVLDRMDATLPEDSAWRMNAPWLRVRMASLYANHDHRDDAKRVALQAVAKPINANRYGKDYAAYLDYMIRQQAATALLDSGHIEDGLELASESMTRTAARYAGRDGFSNVAARVGRELKKLSPAARMELLRKITLSKSVVDLVPNDSPLRLGSGLLRDVYSTNWDLASTARELGELDGLIRELSTLAEPSDSIKSLITLAMVMRDGSANKTKGTSGRSSSASETSARLRSLIETTTAAVPPWEMQDKPDPPLEAYVIASEAALHPEWRELAEQLLSQLIEHSQRTQSGRLRDHFRLAMMEVKRLRVTNEAAASPPQPPAKQPIDDSPFVVHGDWLKLRPKLWDMLGFESASERSGGGLPPTWFTHEGYLSHLSTGRESDLCFALPMLGTFEISGECREGGWTEGRIGYGGVSAGSYAYNNVVYLHATGRPGTETSPKMTNMLHSQYWNRHTIRVDGDSVRFYVNGQLVFEDMPGISSPWLILSGTPGFTPSYRNLRIKGIPIIPSELPLLTDSRLRGWISTFFDESSPDSVRTRRYIEIKLEQNGQQYSTIVEDDGTIEGTPITINQGPTDWMFSEGELRSSQRKDFWGRESHSWLSYLRALRENETLRYEFYYHAGKTIAHPTFGEVVYSLSNNPSNSQANLTASIDGRLTTIATKPPKLKEGWNSASVSLRQGALSIEVNGDEVVSEKIAPANSRRIGFYHDAAASDLRVRNAVLTGDWPRTFDAASRSALETPTPIESLPKTQFLAQTISLNESLISDNSYEISQASLKLEAADRYQFLRRWVLPNGSHDTLRLAGAFTPTHPAPSVLNDNPIDRATSEGRLATDKRLVQTGGNFICPAILLVLSAAELDRLSDLKQEVMSLDPANSMSLAQNRAALLGIIALLDDQPGEAIDRISECLTLLTQQHDVPFHDRWGNVALASLAIQHPDTRRVAYELLVKVEWRQLQPGHSGTPEFDRFVRQLQGQCVYLMYGGTPEEFGAQPKTAQWKSASIPRARSRGTGYPIASFDSIAGELAERGGHDFDAAYFQSPLKGDYEVRCRLSHIDSREMLLMGAGIASAVKWNHGEVRVTHAGQWTKDLPLAQPISPGVLQWLDYKMVVKGGRFTSYVNGQKLYEEDLSPEYDPWLAVVGWAGNSARAVRNLVISGKPEISSELNLISAPDLRGWMTDYYAAEWGQAPFKWTLSEGELKSAQSLEYFRNASWLKVENIIRYHRPMLEDGEITYEFFYDPDVKRDPPADNQRRFPGSNPPQRKIAGKTIVHPALDRMVCLLETDGVKIHWLTDGRWDRTGLMADNIDDSAIRRDQTSPRAHPLPLKPGDWNTILFATSGDTLTIELNGEQILSREIEPTNLRQFGLFHYVNESDVRVRNIRYRGAWPTTLPPISEQDLARGPEDLAAIPEKDLPDWRHWDFTNSNFNLDEFQFHWNPEAGKQIRPTEAGLRFVQSAGAIKPQEAGITPKIQISGDFIATMEYEGLTTTEAIEPWGSGISFKAITQGLYDSGIEIRHAQKSMVKSVRSIYGTYLPNMPWAFRADAIPGLPTAARLRLQRHGNVFYTFIAEPNSDQFRLLNQLPLGTDDIKKIVINADASDKPAGSEFTLKSLSIRASKIVNVK